VRDEQDVWQALLRRKGLSLSDLATRLGVTSQQAHRLLAGQRAAESERYELEQVLALGIPTSGRHLLAIGELDDGGELDVVPAGDTLPLFAARDVALDLARTLEPVAPYVCVLPLWPEHAWRTLVGFHAAWGSEPEVRKVFVVDEAAGDELPIEAVLQEIRSGLEATLRARAQAREPAFLREVEARLSGYTDARLPQ
jgi:transcriptional regulator with XRE-family HTH domain